MSTVQLHEPIPDFTATATSDKTIAVNDLKGRNWVIYFYPKDSTPGCTTEGQDFRDLYPSFQEANTEIFGVSRDSLRSHENFKAKQSFPFELLSDADETLCRLFDVIKLKKMYGKESLGIERSTFLVDQDGVLRQEWRKVKVAGHAAEVLEAVKAL
ncbi:peroxiredoxin [Nitrincola tibetensis]|uniref:thioredoxin-dependent peroxiredoxin n=1 Tax=Nitrincola tibetensis TaxID=2219697 RepID=A0A364NN76_9GAMM|nr:peroxiredoxin [Nitrincola tibetensis]RAU18462.1 peroxiredoxin [Nitrincola tibetensis]